jgi:formylglycine-generating enzyme required for sulfatase activity
MGSRDSPYDDERPVHLVTVPPFEILRTEVTVAQYGECVTAGACTEPGTGDSANWSDPGYEDHPVNYVSWHQAVEFCIWAGGRLPSEAEWEYAARSGGQERTYPWGDAPPTCSDAVMNEGGDGCGTGRTMSVCSKQTGNTAQGLCDMAGNTWEWVQDWYHESYTGAPNDGSAWEVPAGTHRVLHGGSFGGYASGLRATVRSIGLPFGQNVYVSFRCAQDAP